MWIMKIQMTIFANLYKNGHTFESILPILIYEHGIKSEFDIRILFIYS